jgi:predicted nucleic acid-binding protein
LVTGERRGRLTEHETVRFLRDISRHRHRSCTKRRRVVTLAGHHKLTVYDAAYLELAVLEAVLLATLDQALSAAAQAEGIALIGHATG